MVSGVLCYGFYRPVIEILRFGSVCGTCSPGGRSVREYRCALRSRACKRMECARRECGRAFWYHALSRCFSVSRLRISCL